MATGEGAGALGAAAGALGAAGAGGGVYEGAGRDGALQELLPPE